jgi:hypothetical protein
MMALSLDDALPGHSDPKPIVVTKPTTDASPVATLRALATASGTSYLQLAGTLVRLAVGPGRLSFEEFSTLTLAGCLAAAGAEGESFVGFAAARHLWLAGNFRTDHYALAENKVACNALLAAHGFPTTTRLALYSERVPWPSAQLLTGAAHLRDFLRTSDRFPIFGKPMDGHQSLGAVSLERYDAEGDRLVLKNGQTIALDRFVDDIGEHYGRGYVLQKCESPHAELREICGDRLATVRLLTARRRSGPAILRTCLKIPAGENTADNFWRPGNLLAQLDRQTGRILRVLRQTAQGAVEVTHHPDSGVPMIGRQVPHWRQLTDLALHGAAVFDEIALAGWDIAPVARGGIIVELNHTPDFMLHQLADRRGILDAEFRAFLDERREAARAWRRTVKREIKRHFV